ncbi:alcohol dehydrogenase catalytic domain-containing protein [Streptomyces europaeiscabiei]|uniref:alcohol dehydrogenase catalytic domain-containing protein n=1 Tax=Streptomyces europaeiscabiei TaxID=146819 RepID=UPI0029B01E9C|nr:alcohol dehydrogenase catalytic domain-containing protein [Streptomyces europaeiscabiei]MDX2525296.1 alcohol dehydrogenase catalytic domain-containing protein [Streptomyces europaeiscabiei]
MRGVVFRRPGEVRVMDVAEPRVRHPRDVVVRVTRSAICGTDLHPYRGELQGFPDGTVMGHEFAGHVHEVGDEAPFLAGERVFASDLVACGRCDRCRRGWHYQCPEVGLFGYGAVVGTSLPGGQAEFVRVPFADAVLKRTPDDVSDEQALFVGDVLTTAYAAVLDAGVTPGETVGVVGAGPVGLLAAVCASVAGAARVVLADPNPERRKRAADHGFEAVEPDALSAVVCTGIADGADRVIEAVGSDAALTCALHAAAVHGTVVAVGAHHSAAMPFPTGLSFARELTLRFCVGDPIRLRDRVLALVRAGRVDPSTVVSHRFPLDDAPLAYRMFDRQEVFKAVLMH